MKIFFLTLLTLISLFSGGIIFAQEASTLGLSVAPQLFELDVFPGETIKQEIRLKNISDVALPIKARATDFTAEEDSGEMQLDESSQDPSFASRFWFKIEKPDMILEAGELRKIKFEIQVPKDAEKGGHFAAILFEPQVPEFYYKKGEAKIVPNIGVLFLLSVKTLSLDEEAAKKLQVVEFSIPKEQRLAGFENFTSRILGSVAQAASDVVITKQSPSSFVLRLKNIDVYHIKPYGKILIYDIFGRKTGEFSVSQKTILPGKTRQFPVEFSPPVFDWLPNWLPDFISDFIVQNFYFGKYEARLELEAKTPAVQGIYKPDFPTGLVFISLAWKFWLSLVLALILLALFVIKFRKRFIPAVKILISPRSPRHQ